MLIHINFWALISILEIRMAVARGWQEDAVVTGKRTLSESWSEDLF